MKNKPNKTIEGELGPENAEARHLIDVLHKLVDTSQHSRIDDDEDFSNTGVGKDLISKYSFAEIEVDGKEYLVEVRDKELYHKRLNARAARVRRSAKGRKAFELLKSFSHSGEQVSEHYGKPIQ